MKKRRKDYSNGELRPDTSANSEALGRKTPEGLTFRTASITSELPVTNPVNGRTAVIRSAMPPSDRPLLPCGRGRSRPKVQYRTSAAGQTQKSLDPSGEPHRAIWKEIA
jgi:hypothetical protein